MRPDQYEHFRRPLLAVTWAYFLYMVYALLSPRPLVPPHTKLIFSFSHLCSFAVLACLITLVYARWRFALWAILLLFWCVASEILQRYTGRCFEYTDIVQNVIGTGLGLAVGLALRRLAQRSH